MNEAPDEGSSTGNPFESSIAQFAPRSALPQMRGQRAKLQSQLADAIADEDYATAAMLRDDLRELIRRRVPCPLFARVLPIVRPVLHYALLDGAVRHVVILQQRRAVFQTLLLRKLHRAVLRKLLHRTGEPVRLRS